MNVQQKDPEALCIHLRVFASRSKKLDYIVNL